MRPNNELEFVCALDRWRVQTELAWHYSAQNVVEAYRRLFHGRSEWSVKQVRRMINGSMDYRISLRLFLR